MPLTRSEFPHFKPMEEPRYLPAPQRRWSAAEWELIKAGLDAPTMEDKWAAFVENDRLFMCRSWTGRCIYEAAFVPWESGWQIAEASIEGAQNGNVQLHSVFFELLIIGKILDTSDDEAWQRFNDLGGIRGLSAR